MSESSTKTNPAPAWVIGIGASAGGLEALTQFVSNLPEDFPNAIVIAQHLAPHSKSMMVELLAKQSPLPVAAVADGMTIAAKTVYIVPPNHDLDIVDGKMQLTVADEAIRPKPSVDEFFESLARAYGRRAVGIVLSGTGSDGSDGVRAIRAAGGVTLAQDDRSAKYDGMPKSAVDTGSVDSILPPEQLARDLLQILRDHESRLSASQFDRVSMTKIFDIIREQRGQDFRQYKPSTIQRRIARRMALSGIKSIEDYIEKLLSAPGEVGELADELLISVTAFFRDPEVFSELHERLERLVATHPAHQEFRAWVAGCATGEEAYTIAMILVDLQERKRHSFPIKIFATDLDHDALQDARSAHYSKKQLESIPQKYRDKYIVEHDSTFEISKRVRDVVVFARQDLVQNPPFVKLDLVSCRNVMIYFEPELQKRVLSIFHYALNPSGLLVLGKSESNVSTPQLFEAVDKKSKIFVRRNGIAQTVPMARLARSATQMPVVAPLKRPSQVEIVGARAQRHLNRVFEIAGAVVDDEGTLIQVFGDATKYLKFGPNQINLKVSSLLPKTVAIEFPILLKKSMEDQGAHRSRTYKLGRGADASTFQIVVRPLDDDEDVANAAPYFLVTFEPQFRVPGSTAKPLEPDEVPSRVVELEHELHVTREHLQTVIEELGASNEELQSLNEELSSTNEELQATNEELETTNEELQSSNEELTTVNEEISAKSSELRSLSVSLENIQNSIGAPLLILDSRLRLLRYNTEALKIFYVTPNDLGRELTQISSVCEIPDFEEKAKATLESGNASECQCEAANLVYQVRLLPSYDENHRTVGLILIFNDTTDVVRAQERLRTTESRIRAIIEASPTMISLKDNLGRYLIVNNAYMKHFGLEKSIVGKTDREIFDEGLANQMRDSDLEVFLKRAPVKKQELIETDGQQRTFLATRFPLLDSSGKNPVSVGTIALDITSQVAASKALAESEARYKAIVEDQAVFVCRQSSTGELTYTNETFNLYFHYGSSKKRTFLDIVDPADRESTEKVLRSLTPQNSVQHNEHRVSRWNEGIRWIRWIHRGVFDSRGRLLEIQSVGLDVSDYRKQADYLKEREAVFTGVFSNTSDYITIFRNVNGELVLESLNRSAEQMLGHAVTQLIGRPLRDFFPKNSVNEVIERYKRAMETLEPQVVEEELAIAGGIKYFSTTIVPITNEEGKVERVAALSRDVSSYKMIAADLTRAKDSAEVANRAKSDFLASMSHELRTPLNVVLGFCQMLELSDLNAEQSDFVGGIHRSGRLLLTLIEDILDISKIEAGKIKLEYIPFRLRDVAKDVVAMFEVQASDKGVNLKLEQSEDGDQAVLGDPSRLRQVLVNFVGNALKFTAQGSVVVKIEAPRTGTGSGNYRVSVKDTGIGIRDDDHHKIFQKFSQAESGHSRRFGGSGLGLAISKQLIGLMGGSVGFSSAFGSGSSFWFEIPLKRTSNEALMSAPQKPTVVASGTSKRSLKILAVDDNYDSRMVVSLFLKKLGHTYDTAENGERAIELLKKDKFDLVLMDMQMPGMDGCETTIAIRASEIGTKLPIIALTANALTQDVDRCLAAGMDDYLSKPVKLEDLDAILSKWGDEIEFNRVLQPSK